METVGFAQKGKTVAIDVTGAASHTIITVPAGFKFVITYMHVDVSAATNLTFKSGTTALSGLCRFAAAGAETFEAGGEAVLRGRGGAQRDLVIASSAAVDVDGWVTYYLISGSQDYA